jgi:hypothetical protein
MYKLFTYLYEYLLRYACVRACVCVSNIKQHQNKAYLKDQVVDGNVPHNIHKVRNNLSANINYKEYSILCAHWDGTVHQSIILGIYKLQGLAENRICSALIRSITDPVSHTFSVGRGKGLQKKPECAFRLHCSRSANATSPSIWQLAVCVFRMPQIVCLYGLCSVQRKHQMTENK